MDLKEEDDNQSETRQLYLVGTPRDPLVSAGSIVDTTNDDINQNSDLQTSALAGLMAGQSSSVCFPTKFSKFYSIFFFFFFINASLFSLKLK